MRRWLPSAAALVAASLFVVVGPVPAAQAVGQCEPNSFSTDFQPPLVATPRNTAMTDVTIVGSACTTTNPVITSMLMEGSGTGLLSCAGSSTAHGNGAFRWTTLLGTTLHSGAEWTVDKASVAGADVWTFTGSFTSGEFSGQGFRFVAVTGTNPLECAAAGVEKVNGPGVFAIL
ncbi:hypothetical protein [Saccharothrix obliqua]|uniref:hypothetical protein n=1 Tax=Saccharothrix obliqua TaxID=2861747 RepID=UPI001C5E6F56|nr:hypothetical protein [Saccharothrix obliqua]MBW4718633.1 hypothetical protein [Saccharothrix obliqua]